MIKFGQVVEEVCVEVHMPIPIVDAAGLLEAVDRCNLLSDGGESLTELLPRGTFTEEYRSGE